MPSIVPGLAPSDSMIYCPGCRDQGNENSRLIRPDQTGKLQCQFGHVYPTWGALQALNPKMVPMGDFFHEQPNPEAMKYSFFVMPKIMDILKRKYPQNLMTTVATVLDCLADDTVMVLQGSEVAELHKRGIKNGQQILATLDSFKSLERERQQAVDELTRVMEALSKAGV